MIYSEQVEEFIKSKIGGATKLTRDEVIHIAKKQNHPMGEQMLKDEYEYDLYIDMLAEQEDELGLGMGGNW